MSKATETAMKLLESLPEQAQERVVEALATWYRILKMRPSGTTLRPQLEKLVAAARQASKDVSPRGKLPTWTSNDFEVADPARASGKP